MDIEKAPFEVLNAWMYTSGHVKYCRIDTYQEIMNTIDKYPEYFPWETVYKKIPNEVHKAYTLKVNQLYDSMYPEQKCDMIPGEGIYKYILRKSEEPKVSLTKKSLEEAFHEMFVVIPKRKEKFDIGKKKLWKEFYGKYKLKYRET